MKRRPPIIGCDECRPHRGVALLIVLATLVLAISASVSLVRLASTARLRQQVQDRVAIADGLLDAAEAVGGPIQHWLTHDSSNIALPVDNTIPAISVLHDRWVDAASSDQLELCITAFDQCGMVPWRLAGTGSPLRLTLPTEMMNVLDQHPLVLGAGSQSLGLDEFRIEQQDRVCVFPVSVKRNATLFGDASSVVGEDRGHPDSDPTISLPALGGLVATHPAGDVQAPAAINVNTAPMSLIEAAMRAAGRDGIEVIATAREQGKPAPAPQGPPSVSNRSISNLPQFVSSSTCWAFRIDCRVGPLRRSWWMIYQPSANRSSSPSKPWECVQRLVITE